MVAIRLDGRYHTRGDCCKMATIRGMPLNRDVICIFQKGNKLARRIFQLGPPYTNNIGITKATGNKRLVIKDLKQNKVPPPHLLFRPLFFFLNGHALATFSFTTDEKEIEYNKEERETRAELNLNLNKTTRQKVTAGATFLTGHHDDNKIEILDHHATFLLLLLLEKKNLHSLQVTPRLSIFGSKNVTYITQSR